MRVFPNHELRYYAFGLRAGVANLLSNGLRLGLKKTIGKITQPINAPSRFPEYDQFASAIHDHLSRLPPASPGRILDVGSPKLIGLYLAHTTTADVTLTDISELNVDEYKTMWRGLQPSARGRVEFSLQDARSLDLPADTFDVVYSMSVIEHVEGGNGDSQAVSELVRVLKPGGLLVLSVPFGRNYIEQQRMGLAGAARRTSDSQAHFFQRIYDPAAFRARILAPANGLEQVTVTTVARRNGWVSRAQGAIGENIRGVLGFMNPILSVVLNTTKPGIDENFDIDYGPIHSTRDIYGDLIMVGRKRA